MKAIILAAGYATRLYPLTLNIPKPLLYITGDKTVIDLIADDLVAAAKVEEIIVVTNHKFYPHFKEWAAHRKLPCGISVLDDGTLTNDDRLGAIGDIAFAVSKKKIDTDLTIIAGDNLFDSGFREFFDSAVPKAPYASLGLFDIKDKTAAKRFGIVSVDRSGRVNGFEEKPARPKSTLAATCLYYFPKSTLRLLKQYLADPGQPKDAPGNYIRWLTQRDTVYGFPLASGRWYDIGHLDSYKEVISRFAEKNKITTHNRKGKQR